MRKIFKYEVPIKETFELSMPTDAQILRVEDVDGRFYLWAVVDPDSERVETRLFECYKTGQPIDTNMDDLKYLGCCKLFIMQELCLYVFERAPS